MGVGIQLVVLGDMLDLTHLQQRGDPEDALAAGIVRFGRIAAAHAPVFDRLARFVAAGGRLRIVIGNHDLELAHPALQEQFLERLHVRGDAAAASRSVTFHSWFFHIPDVIYAEHGHRYHDINAVRVPDGTSVPGIDAPDETPLAAYLDAWVRALRARRAGGTWTVLLLKRTIADATRRGLPGPTAYPGVDEGGLDQATLLAIDRLGARIGLATVARVTGTLLGPPIRALMPYVIASSVGRLALRGHRRGCWAAMAVASAAGVISLVRRRRPFWPPPRSTAYALRAARALDATLERAGQRSPVYVLGHTHVPTRTALAGRDDQPWYLNTGSWTDRADGRGEYPFVRVTRGASGDVRSELLWWPPRHI